MSVVGYGVFVFAAAPIGGYTPGSTLDPDCAPGSTDCVVAFVAGGTGTPAGSNNQIQINQSGSFFADSTFQKSDTDFNVGLDTAQQSAVTFAGAGLDDIIVAGAFSGTAPTTYTVTIDGVNKTVFNVDLDDIVGGSFAVGQTITTGANTATIDGLMPNTLDNNLFMTVTITSGSFNPTDIIDNGSGVTAPINQVNIRDTFSVDDGTTVTPFVPIFIDVLFAIVLGSETGHTLSDSWTWDYTTVNQNVLDFSNNDYKFQSVFGTDTFGYQIGDNLLGAGITGSANTYTNIAGDQMLTGYADPTGLGSIGFISLNLYSTGEISTMYANKNGVGYSIQDSFGENVVQTTSGVTTLGNLSGGNGTKITIDDIAQTINFNNNYSFPFVDGTANQVLTTDGAGQLSWTTVSGGSSLPTQTGHNGEYLTTNGTSASWTTIAGGGILGIGTINSQTRSANGASISGSNLILQTSNRVLPGLLVGETDSLGVTLGIGAGVGANTSRSVFVGVNAGNGASGASDTAAIGYMAGLDATYAYNSNFFGGNAGYYATGANDSNFMGYDAGKDATGASSSNFFGPNAGNGATDATFSNFIGPNAGVSATNASSSNFFGLNAGYSATYATNSNFFGDNSGYAATNSDHSNFFGYAAGQSASDADHSNFFGYASGYLATNAANSNFIGRAAGYQATNAANSIFIGYQSGNQDVVDNTVNAGDYSILIGPSTSTGGFENSIAIGGSATNTASNQFMIGSATRPIDEIVMVSTGGTTCATDINGTACSSDERLKTNITDLTTDTLDKVLNVKTVTFNWNNNTDTINHIGFIAQDIEQYFPELVSTGSTGYLSVNYAGMTPVLVQAIREMNLKITTINDVETPNSWRDSLIAWFGNVENGITKLFANEIDTKNLCVSDDAGGKTCITKAQLDQLLMNSGSGGSSSNPIVITPDPTPTPDPDVTGDTGGDSPSDQPQDNTDTSGDSEGSSGDTGSSETPIE